MTFYCLVTSPFNLLLMACQESIVLLYLLVESFSLEYLVGALLDVFKDEILVLLADLFYILEFPLVENFVSVFQGLSLLKRTVPLE